MEDPAAVRSPEGWPPLAAAPVADALVRLGRPVRMAPWTVRRARPGSPVNGPALTVLHLGSVDAFLEALERATPGAVMVIDNQGRTDEGCIGDLTVGECLGAGLAGMVVWGCHRDDAVLRTMAMPVWSLGTVPAGPVGVRPTPAGAPGGEPSGISFADASVRDGDMVVADDDGVVFVDATAWPSVAEVARHITATEAAQAQRLRAGTSLRAQLGFADYLARRRRDPGFTLRDHLRERRGAIET